MMKPRAKSYLSLSPRLLPAEVERKDLLNRITHASEISLLVLAAPSGYGKTTLLGQLTRAADHPVWLTLSERHTDLMTLVNELMTSVAQVAKDADFTHIRKAISEGAQVSALAVPLARELDALGVNLHILVDQANLLGDGAVTWLESFALALGEGHRLSYGAYDLASERLAVPLAAGRALLLTTTDLAFSEEESRTYLRARGSTQDAGDVQRALEGWPAGIGLAAAEVGHIVSPDNLLETVFNRLSEEVRGALPEASVLEVWREVDAEKLSCKLPKGWLREAQRSGLPLTPLSTKTYRPHTLVLERLERELQNQPERYAELHTQAGDNARKNEDLTAALQHYRKAGRLSEAFEIVEELIPQLHDRQEFKLICELLEPLLPTVERFPPEVFAYYGHALFSTGQLKRSERVFQDLQASEQGEPLTSIFLADILYEQRRYAKMYETICRVVTQVDKSAHFYTAQRMLVRALIELGRHDKALALIQNVIARAETEGNQLQLASALLSLEVLYFRTGDYAACERTILKALDCYANLKMTNSLHFIVLSNNLASLYGVQGRFEDTLAIVSHLISSLGLEEKDFVRRPQLLYQLAYVLEAMTEYKAAVVYYEEALSLALEYGLSEMSKQIKYALSASVRRSGNPDRARELLGEASQSWSNGERDWAGQKHYHEGLDAFDHGNLQGAKQNFESALLNLNHPALDYGYIISSHAYLL